MTDEDAAQSSPPEGAPPAPPEPAAPSEAPIPDPPPSPEASEGQSAPDMPTAQQRADEPLPPSASAPTRDMRSLGAKGHAATEVRKQKKLSRIMEAVSANGKIANDEVEKLLHVSDATATRYLAMLVKEGKLKKLGTTGKHVVYLKS